MPYLRRASVRVSRFLDFLVSNFVVRHDAKRYNDDVEKDV